ncbi:MAG: secretion protein HlyD [Undibacterium sp.]|nr:secretion protein HlyD [Undibacterium sp.]
MKKILLASVFVILISGLGACSDQTSDKTPIEVLQLRPWQEELVADGEVKSAASTELSVPGSNYANRSLVFMVPDGSLVEKGQVIAKFEATQAKIRLSQFETDMLRKEIAEVGIEANAAIGRAQLSTDSAKVDGDLNLSKRYANADLSVFAQNKILDILIDMGFLNDKQHYLAWKNSQISVRANAEHAVLASQKENVARNIREQKDSLSALEVTAPHQGVFKLKPNWDGSFAQVGSVMWAGMDLGSLPDLTQQVAQFSIPEGASFGLKEGLSVKVRLAGTGTEMDLKVTEVGKSASTKSKLSPVKYSDFEAKIDQALVQKLGLKPGQAVSAKVSLQNSPQALTVPNIALVQDGNDYFVYVQDGSKTTKQKIELGLRGPNRSEIKSGVSVGSHIVLIPKKMEEKS